MALILPKTTSWLVSEEEKQSQAKYQVYTEIKKGTTSTVTMNSAAAKYYFHKGFY